MKLLRVMLGGLRVAEIGRREEAWELTGVAKATFPRGMLGQGGSGGLTGVVQLAPAIEGDRHGDRKRTKQDTESDTRHVLPLDGDRALSCTKWTVTRRG